MTEDGAVKGSPARKGCLLTTVILVVGIAVGIGAGIGIGSGIWKDSGSGSGSASPQREWLFSLAASSGSLEISNSSEWKLTMYGLNGNVSAFTNRPYREYATLSYQNMTDSMNEPSSEGSMNAVLAFNDGGNYIMAPIDIKSATLSDNGTTLTMGVVLLVDQQSDNTGWIGPMLNLMAKDGYLTQVGNSTYSLQLDQPYLFIDSVMGWVGAGLGVVAAGAAIVATGGAAAAAIAAYVGSTTAAVAATATTVTASAGLGSATANLINEG